tara:strand:+ start:524 stop:739 length:216 start_codon:yes stop_codon:yes gene_type:complete
MCGNGLASSVAHVHELIDAQIADGIPAGKILVGGFSQGSTARRLHWQAVLDFGSCAFPRARLAALGASALS